MRGQNSLTSINCFLTANLHAGGGGVDVLVTKFIASCYWAFSPTVGDLGAIQSIHHTSLFLCAPYGPKINFRQKLTKEHKYASAASKRQREQWQCTFSAQASYLSHQCLDKTIGKHAECWLCKKQEGPSTPIWRLLTRCHFLSISTCHQKPVFVLSANPGINSPKQYCMLLFFFFKYRD